ncbi:putative beta-glucan synthesis-associated protein (SKN1) [Lyophyllum shimeji]|uniref:Beta-glucan synthesis-associated protein (SKN1) n=1 Tax=Lyophyllum shimeji TaxID=47721 RepID=A0A9P3PSN0_LYOSH|nr:putative beta-glucan synthesis-associated protein (SKN1) [Lyophyllum shimeji]
MSPRPQSWVGDYEDVEFDLAFSDTPPSGRYSPHERQRMLPDEGTQPTRPAYMLDNTPMSSSSTSSPRTSHLPLGLTSDGVPRYHVQEPPIGRPRSTGPEPRNQMPRAASYRSIASSPLNPAFPSGPPSFNVLSPFSRPGSRGSAHITRIPSEESRALSQGPPFMANSTSSRGSMILYRRADTTDDVLLPPSFPHANRSSVVSTSGDSYLSLSSDSKYPSGMMTPERGLVAYAYDPSLDADEPLDEMDDALHDPEKKVIKVPGRPTSWRGFKNLAALVALVLGLLTLFVFYPVYQFYQDNGRTSLIVGNTRINATGQADYVEVSPRSQIPIVSLRGVIDPATPEDAMSRGSWEGEVYNLVFSDEFNDDGRTFSKDDDRFWEIVDHHSRDARYVTTRDGYLVFQPYVVPADDASTRRYIGHALRHRTPYCLEEGYVEISAVMPGSSARRFFWYGNRGWSGENMAAVPHGIGLSEILLLHLHLQISAGFRSHHLALTWPALGPSAVLVDYVRVYQKDGALASSCDSHLHDESLNFSARQP